MISEKDTEYLSNYKVDTLYVIPGAAGAYTTLVGEDEVAIAEVEVTSRSRLAVSAFFVENRKDFGSFKITRFIYHKKYGWREDGSVRINDFDRGRMQAFLSVISSLDFSGAEKTKIALDNIDIRQIDQILKSTIGDELVKVLAKSPELHRDIYALNSKREAIDEFEQLMASEASEADWQRFFEREPWIFGHGLSYVFLDKVADKLEVTTTGHTFQQSGKRTDALLRTRAEVSQYVFVEIKKNSTKLLRDRQYRSGCWVVSDELIGAVMQTQKTVFEFAREHFRDRLRDAEGFDLPEEVYSIYPQSYLVIGNLSQIHKNDDMITCFELYRKSVSAPVILTFDELYYRAQQILANLQRREEAE